MTAEQLTKRLLELRRRYHADVEEAKGREEKVRALFEELRALGCAHLFRGPDVAPGFDATYAVQGLQQALRNKFYNDALELIKAFVGLP